jgi:hypothetical protein
MKRVLPFALGAALTAFALIVAPTLYCATRAVRWLRRRLGRRGDAEHGRQQRQRLVDAHRRHDQRSGQRSSRRARRPRRPTRADRGDLAERRDRRPTGRLGRSSARSGSIRRRTARRTSSRRSKAASTPSSRATRRTRPRGSSRACRRRPAAQRPASQALAAVPTSATAVFASTTCLWTAFFSNSNATAQTVTLTDNAGTPLNAVGPAFSVPALSFVIIPFNGVPFTSGVKWTAGGTGVLGGAVGFQ